LAAKEGDTKGKKEGLFRREEKDTGPRRGKGIAMPVKKKGSGLLRPKNGHRWARKKRQWLYGKQREESGRETAPGPPLN